MRTKFIVMPGLVPGIHVLFNRNEDVDGRDKPGHDDGFGSHQPSNLNETFNLAR